MCKGWRFMTHCVMSYCNLSKTKAGYLTQKQEPLENWSKNTDKGLTLNEPSSEEAQMTTAKCVDARFRLFKCQESRNMKVKHLAKHKKVKEREHVIVKCIWFLVTVLLDLFAVWMRSKVRGHRRSPWTLRPVGKGNRALGVRLPSRPGWSCTRWRCC